MQYTAKGLNCREIEVAPQYIISHLGGLSDAITLLDKVSGRSELPPPMTKTKTCKLTITVILRMFLQTSKVNRTFYQQHAHEYFSAKTKKVACM
jgi:hypothetical protein